MTARSVFLRHADGSVYVTTMDPSEIHPEMTLFTAMRICGVPVVIPWSREHCVATTITTKMTLAEIVAWTAGEVAKAEKYRRLAAKQDRQDGKAAARRKT